LRQPGDEVDEAEEGEVISATVDYAASLTFDDEQHGLGLILGGSLLDKFLNVGTKPTVA
jgi:hypothetical protein